MAALPAAPQALGNAYATVLNVTAGQTWRIQYSAVANTGSAAQDLFVQLVDSDAGTTRLIIPGTPIPGKLTIQPLFEGDLVLTGGDQLQARGPTTGTVNLNMFLTYDNGT